MKRITLDWIAIVGVLLLRSLPHSAAQELRGAPTKIALRSNNDTAVSVGGTVNSVKRKKILFVHDVTPMQSGARTAIINTIRVLGEMGHEVLEMSPHTLNLPMFPLYGIDSNFMMSIPWFAGGKIARMIDEFDPDHIHISTEALLSSHVRSLCLKNGWKFSSAFHTDSAAFLNRKIWMPELITWASLRNFHSKSSSVMPPCESTRKKLAEWGFDPKTLRLWGRGVDFDTYHPREPNPVKFPKTNGPILMYVGRVSKEKGIHEFLKLPMPGFTKYVVGDGVDRPALQKKYPDAVYMGYLSFEEVGEAMANADVFVFPSKTETWGNVITEAMASGTPVAGYPATGSIDLITYPEVGAVDDNLEVAINKAYAYGNREECARYVRTHYTWEVSTQQFLDNLVPVHCRAEDGCVEPDSPSGFVYQSILALLVVLLVLKHFNYWPVMQRNVMLLCLMCKMRRQYHLVSAILDLNAQGFASDEIAEELECSTDTVDKCLTELNKIANVGNKTELMRLWRDDSVRKPVQRQTFPGFPRKSPMKNQLVRRDSRV